MKVDIFSVVTKPFGLYTAQEFRFEFSEWHVVVPVDKLVQSKKRVEVARCCVSCNLGIQLTFVAVVPGITVYTGKFNCAC